MANTDNSCKDLEVEDLYSKSKNTLGDLYELQKDIQENVYKYDFEKMRTEMNLGEFRRFYDWNYIAIQSELMETFDALGGIKDGIGNAVWKPWKQKHSKLTEMKFDDMSKDDKKELKMELIDIQHFLFNMMLAAGMTTEELFNYYFSKNAENRRRQKNGYLFLEKLIYYMQIYLTKNKINNKMYIGKDTKSSEKYLGYKEAGLRLNLNFQMINKKCIRGELYKGYYFKKGSLITNTINNEGLSA